MKILSGFFVLVTSVLLFGLGYGTCLQLNHIAQENIKVTEEQRKEKEVVRLPFEVYINGERWNIEPHNFFMDGFPWIGGDTSCSQRNIRFNPEFMSPSVSRENLWHEVGHALRCNKQNLQQSNWHKYAISDDHKPSKEHETVYELGMGMSQFVHDNPEFMRWAEDWK